MREAGKRLALIVYELAALALPGATTGELEAHARKRLDELGASSAFLGYDAHGQRPPFPSVLCTSINDELIHAPALPSRTLKDGDIIGIDFGLRYPVSAVVSDPLLVIPSRAEGSRSLFPEPSQRPFFYVDMAVTVAVGAVSPRTQTLLTVTRDALARAIAVVKPGVHLKEIARVIQSHVESQGFSVVRDYVGHGIGKELHEPPEVPNFISREFPDIILESGMTIAIEPMVTMGSSELTHGQDEWTAKTKDGSLAAHFEHTIAVTATGAEVLTKPSP